MKNKIELPEQTLFNDLSALIEKSKQFVIVQANSVMTMLFWNVGKRIVSPLATQLSWTHFMELMPIKDEKAPESCPCCNHPQSFFELAADNY